MKNNKKSNNEKNNSTNNSISIIAILLGLIFGISVKLALFIQFNVFIYDKIVEPLNHGKLLNEKIKESLRNFEESDKLEVSDSINNGIITANFKNAANFQCNMMANAFKITGFNVFINNKELISNKVNNSSVSKYFYKDYFDEELKLLCIEGKNNHISVKKKID